MYDKNTYEYRKVNNLCVKCGRKAIMSKGKFLSRCSRCKAKEQNYYYKLKLKLKNIKKPAPKLNKEKNLDKTSKLLNKISESIITKNKKEILKSKNIKKRYKDIYHERKREYRCVRCGKKLDIDEKEIIVYCKECRNKKSEYEKKRRDIKKSITKEKEDIDNDNIIYYDDPVLLIEKDPIFESRKKWIKR